MSADSEIRNLLARIAHLADSGTIEEYAQLFAEDAVWQMPANPAAGAPADRREGRPDIVAGVVARREAGVQGPGTATRHVLTTTAVDVTSATAVSYWMFFADTGSAPRLVSVGRYDDAFREVGGRWLLAQRTITVG